MSKTETSKSVIYREAPPTRNNVVDSFLDTLAGWDSYKTTIVEKETGECGRGIGNTQAEADQAARDDLADKRGR